MKFEIGEKTNIVLYQNVSKATNINLILRRVTLKRHLSIGVFVVYIDTGSPVPSIPLKSRGLADENRNFLTEWNDSKV